MADVIITDDAGIEVPLEPVATDETAARVEDAAERIEDAVEEREDGEAWESSVDGRLTGLESGQAAILGTLQTLASQMSENQRLLMESQTATILQQHQALRESLTPAPSVETVAEPVAIVEAVPVEVNDAVESRAPETSEAAPTRKRLRTL